LQGNRGLPDSRDFFWGTHMNKALATAIAMLGLVISGPVVADVIGFTDGFAPGTWTVNFTGTLLTPGGSLGSVTETPTTFTLVGGNGPSPAPPNFAADCSGCPPQIFDLGWTDLAASESQPDAKMKSPLPTYWMARGARKAELARWRCVTFA
jgi:hypothetical protein